MDEMIDLAALPAAPQEYDLATGRFATRDVEEHEEVEAEATTADAVFGSCEAVANTSVHPFASVALLKINIGSGAARGSGFFISDRLVLTAGHCVHSRFGPVTSIEVFPGFNGNFARRIVTQHFAPSPDYLVDPGDPLNDFGIIFVPPGASPVHFGFDFLSDDRLRTALHVQGYPLGITDQVFCTGPLKNIGAGLFTYSIPTGEGESGGPVWPDDPLSAIAGGIHLGIAADVGAARRIDGAVLAQIATWSAT